MSARFLISLAVGARGPASGPRRLDLLIEERATGDANDGVMIDRDRQQGSAESAQQVEAIEDLAGLRGATSRVLGKDLGAVTSDDGDAGMSTQPSRDALGGAVGQKIEDGMPLQVDEHGAVAAAAPPRPLIDADDARFGMGWQGSGPDEAQERIATHGHGQSLCQPGSRLATECETEVAREVVQAHRAAGVRLDDVPTPCSLKVRRGQAGLVQRKRRTLRRRETGRPCQGRSAEVRW